MSSRDSDWRERWDRGSIPYELRDAYETHKRKIKAGLAGILAGITMLSGVYTVPQDSTGIVNTFGAYSRQTKPGLHFKVPFVESVTKVPNQAIFTEAIGFRNLQPGVKSEFAGVPEIKAGKVDEDVLEQIIADEGVRQESDLAAQAAQVLRNEYLMLTGDLNMADVEFIVQYRIRDPMAYAFNVRDHRGTLRDLAESSARAVVGDASVDEVITIGRTQIEQLSKEKLQERLNFYKTGLEVVALKLQSANVPERVRPSFNAVNSAIQQKQETINKAMEQYNKEIPLARGEAEALVRQAEGYAIERVNKADGDTAKFKAVYQEYKSAPAITRARLYLEAMPDVLHNAARIYLIESGKGSSLLLQKLDLDGGGQK